MDPFFLTHRYPDSYIPGYPPDSRLVAKSLLPLAHDLHLEVASSGLLEEHRLFVREDLPGGSESDQRQRISCISCISCVSVYHVYHVCHVYRKWDGGVNLDVVSDRNMERAWLLPKFSNDLAPDSKKLEIEFKAPWLPHRFIRMV